MDPLTNLVVRTTGDLAATSALHSTIRSVDPNIVISSINSMDGLLSQQEVQRRFQTWLVSVFSAIALCLAALGIFAVMHYAVTARTNEIGIRMAVGARPSDISRLMLANGMRLALFGVLAGAFAAMWLTRAMAAFLYGVTPSDPISFAGAAGILTAVAMCATYLPALRAARTDPLNALRRE